MGWRERKWRGGEKRRRKQRKQGEAEGVEGEEGGNGALEVRNSHQ